MKTVKVNGINTEQRKIMDFVGLALKMNNIKIKAYKKEVIFIITLNVINVKRNSFFKIKNTAKQDTVKSVLIC